MVALENHLNYIYHESRELSENELFGVAALLNSRLYDRYFRLVSGSTQVNATELRTIPFPSLDVLEVLGERVLQSMPLGEAVLDDMVHSVLFSERASVAALVESSK
jgi:adenine-specific DNA-methyltransferase